MVNPTIMLVLTIVVVSGSRSSVTGQRIGSGNRLTLAKPFSSRESSRPRTNLHIGGLFPISGTGGWQGGQGCLPAARMALNDVNAEPYLLPGYRLVLHWNDSQVGQKFTEFLIRSTDLVNKNLVNKNLLNSSIH